MSLHEFQVVRIARFIRPLEGRFHDSSVSPPPPPQIGETGTIVNISGAQVTVENVDAEGDTVWVCDFAAEELEVVG
jgi:hypothetical protein